MAVRVRTFKSHHPFTRRASITNCHAHGTVKRRNDGKPIVRNHPTTVTAIQPSEQPEGQNGWCRLYGTRSKRTKSKLRRTQESPSNRTALYSLGFRDSLHGNTRDSTRDKTQQQQRTRRSDTCLTKVPSYLSEKQLRAEDQEHWSTNHAVTPARPP